MNTWSTYISPDLSKTFMSNNFNNMNNNNLNHNTHTAINVNGATTITTSNQNNFGSRTLLHPTLDAFTPRNPNSRQPSISLTTTAVLTPNSITSPSSSSVNTSIMVSGNNNINNSNINNHHHNNNHNNNYTSQPNHFKTMASLQRQSYPAFYSNYQYNNIAPTPIATPANMNTTNESFATIASAAATTTSTPVYYYRDQNNSYNNNNNNNNNSQYNTGNIPKLNTGSTQSSFNYENNMVNNNTKFLSFINNPMIKSNNSLMDYNSYIPGNNQSTQQQSIYQQQQQQQQQNVSISTTPSQPTSNSDSISYSNSNNNYSNSNNNNNNNTYSMVSTTSNNTQTVVSPSASSLSTSSSLSSSSSSSHSSNNNISHYHSNHLDSKHYPKPYSNPKLINSSNNIPNNMNSSIIPTTNNNTSSSTTTTNNNGPSLSSTSSLNSIMNADLSPRSNYVSLQQPTFNAPFNTTLMVNRNYSVAMTHNNIHPDNNNNSLVAANTNTDPRLNTFLHRCHLCEKRFKRQSWLKRHLLSHSTERRFLCQWCLSRHKRKDNLLQHIKLKHSKYLLQELKSANVNFKWQRSKNFNYISIPDDKRLEYVDSIKTLLYQGILSKEDVKRVLNEIIKRNT